LLNQAIQGILGRAKPAIHFPPKTARFGQELVQKVVGDPPANHSPPETTSFEQEPLPPWTGLSGQLIEGNLGLMQPTIHSPPEEGHAQEGKLASGVGEVGRIQETDDQPGQGKGIGLHVRAVNLGCQKNRTSYRR
jgi:hypothetical protein